MLLVIGLCLGGVVLGIVLWIFIQWFQQKRRERGGRRNGQRHGKRPIEVDGNKLSDCTEGVCERRDPVPATFLADDINPCNLNDEKTAIQERLSLKHLQALSKETGRRAGSDGTRTIGGSSICVGESALSPVSSVFTFPIQGTTTASDVADSEQWYLRREVALVREQRVRLEKLEQLDALRKREDELGTVLSTSRLSSSSSIGTPKHILSSLRNSRH